MGYNSDKSEAAGLRKFRAFFGISPKLCEIIWCQIEDKPFGSKPKHLLWSMLFLKTYSTESINAAIVKADEKTYRSWVWRFVALLAGLSVVSI